MYKSTSDYDDEEVENVYEEIQEAMKYDKKQ